MPKHKIVLIPYRIIIVTGLRCLQYLFLSITLSLCFVACREEGNKTSRDKSQTAIRMLYIVGGGERTDSMMREIVRLSGWKSGDLIAAVTLPSGWGDSAYIWLNNDFKKITGMNCVKIDSASIHSPQSIDSLKRSKIIFISGGDQNRMIQLIKGTEVRNAIYSAFQGGSLVGGTSAGASIVSKYMITGNGLIDTVYESTLPELWKGNLELSEGLGLLDSVIIDQHFIVRSRYNRLLSALTEHPAFQCIGIDESTALFIHGDSATVCGTGQVVELASPVEVHTYRDTLIGARKIIMNIYLPGETFPVRQ